MPQHKSCAKRMRTSDEQRLRNRAFRSRLRSLVRDLRNQTSQEEASKRYRDVTSLLDEAASHGLIHKKNADRNKSRLARFIRHLS